MRVDIRLGAALDAQAPLITSRRLRGKGADTLMLGEAALLPSLSVEG
jgi:hypothetical protein